MKLNLKYNATNVDEIEQLRKLPIENCISDSSIGMLALFIQKGLIDDKENHGVSRSVALDVIDKFLAESDKTELMLEVIEALVDGGFLSRELNVKNLRETKTKREAQVNNMIMNEI